MMYTIYSVSVVVSDKICKVLKHNQQKRGVYHYQSKKKHKHLKTSFCIHMIYMSLAIHKSNFKLMLKKIKVKTKI